MANCTKCGACSCSGAIIINGLCQKCRALLQRIKINL